MRRDAEPRAGLTVSDVAGYVSRRMHLPAVLGMLVLLMPGAVAAANRIVDLGADFFPVAVNDNAVVAGDVLGDAARWNDGVVTMLPPLATYLGSEAHGINAAGDVVGRSENFSASPSRLRATVWPATGGAQAIAPAVDNANVPLSVANAINATGVVAGDSAHCVGMVCGYPQAATGTAGGTFSLLPPNDLGSSNSRALDINDAGVIVGYVAGAGAMWVNGSYTSLGTFRPVAINASGAMAGGVGPQGLPYERTAAGELVAIPVGGTARDINAAGDVVGSESGDGWLRRNGTMMRVDDLLPPDAEGWDILTADAISDGGVIVGRAMHDGTAVGYLLAPPESCPVPAASIAPTVRVAASQPAAEAPLALAITRAIVRVNPTRTDSVRLTGRLDGFALDQLTSLRLVLDGVGFTVPIGELVAKGSRRRYRSKAPGLRSLVLTKSGAFTASWRGIVLATIDDTIAVDAQGDMTRACTIVRLSERGGRKPRKAGRPPRPRRWVATSQGVPVSCAVSAPRFAPANVIVSAPGQVRAEASVSGPAATGAVELWPADTDGRPTGAAICNLRDDGSDGDTVAGDGRFACTFTVDTSVAARLEFAVTARVDENTVASEASPLRIVPPPDAAQLAEIERVLGLAQRSWNDAKATAGDSLAARWTTMRALRLDPAVESVTLADEDGSIAIRFTAGPRGILNLTPREAVPAGAVPEPLAPRRRAGDDATARTIVGNHKVLIWDPGYFPHHEGVVLRDLFAASTCPRFDVTLVERQDTTLASLQHLTDYGTVALVTHGLASKHPGWNCFELGSTIATEVDALVAGDLDASINEAGAVTSCVRASFIRGLAGTFADALVWGGFCFSGLTDATSGSRAPANAADFYTPVPGESVDSLVEAFRGKGAAAFYGFPRKVSDDWAFALSSAEVFPGLLAHRDTRAIWDDISERSDPVMAERHILVPFLLLPADARLAYTNATIVPATAILPPDGAQTIRVELEGMDECTVALRWKNTGQAGHLVGGDDQRGATTSVTYMADSEVGDLQDVVTVEVIDTAAVPERTMFTRSATVQVGCPVTIAAP